MTGRVSKFASIAGWVLACIGTLAAQNCTTQARMSVDARAGLADAGLAFANQVKAADVTSLQSSAIAEYASNFGAAKTLVLDTSNKLAGDSLSVSHMYVLDAHNRKANDSSDADFTCELQGSAAEVDFSISGLPPGLYGFVMVEASGARPWLLSFLMRQENGKWKLAGFYPHARTAAGHAGLWYWNSARDDAKAKNNWISWLMYGEADALLRPANFATSSNLDKLRAEQRTVAPPGLSDGIGPQTPLVLKDSKGAEFRFTGIGAEGSDDGKRLNLVLHVEGDSSLTASAEEAARNLAAATAILDAHKELRTGFDGVTVISELPGRSPFVTEQSISEIH